MTKLNQTNRFFYGWYIVAACWFSFFITYGVVIFAILIFYEPISKDLGWSRGFFYGAYSAGILSMAITGPAIGKLIDIYGAKLIMLLGSMTIGGAIFYLSQITSLWQFYLGYIAAGIGLAASSGVSINPLISRWFQKRRGLAIGISYTGMGLGGFVMSPITETLLQFMDWQSVMIVFASFIWASLIPTIVFMVKSDPYELGLLPDGTTNQQIKTQRKMKRSEVYATLPGDSLSQAIRTPKFWLVVFVFFTALFSSNGTFSQIQPFLLDLGYSTTTATTILSLIGLLAAITKFAYGYLSDKVEVKKILLIATVGAAIAPILTLAVSSLNGPKWLCLLYPIPLGLGATAFSTLTPIVAAAAFGIRHIGAISGSLSSCMLLGMAGGPFFTAKIYDISSAYTIPAGITTIAMAIAIICLVLGPKLTYKNSYTRDNAL